MRSRPKGRLARGSNWHVLCGAVVFCAFDVGWHDAGDLQVLAVGNGAWWAGQSGCKRERVNHVMTRVEDRWETGQTRGVTWETCLCRVHQGVCGAMRAPLHLGQGQGQCGSGIFLTWSGWLDDKIYKIYKSRQTWNYLRFSEVTPVSQIRTTYPQTSPT